MSLNHNILHSAHVRFSAILALMLLAGCHSAEERVGGALPSGHGSLGASRLEVPALRLGLAQPTISPFAGSMPVLGVGVLEGSMLTALASTAAGSPSLPTAVADLATTTTNNACPPEMVLVEGDGCHDVTHECLEYVPNDPAHRCLEFKKGADTCLPPIKKVKMCMDRYEWPGTPGAQPRVLVDYFEAERLCQSVGKRMCDEDEFYLACEGPEHWPYAWGHQRHPSPCNVDRPYVMVDWQKWGQGPTAQLEEAKRLDQATPIGASHCVSPFGVHDIAGNVDEWTTARAGRELKGSLMGGYWGPVQNACRYVTTVHGPEFQFYQIGFRCCANPKS